MKFFDNIKARINSSLEQREDAPAKSERVSRIESLLGGSIQRNGSISWGVVILIAFAVYALVNLVIVILKFFG